MAVHAVPILVLIGAIVVTIVAVGLVANAVRIGHAFEGKQHIATTVFVCVCAVLGVVAIVGASVYLEGKCSTTCGW